MAYDCQYAVDRGVPCSQWTREGEPYCTTHSPKMAAIDTLEREVNDVIEKARRK